MVHLDPYTLFYIYCFMKRAQQHNYFMVWNTLWMHMCGSYCYYTIENEWKCKAISKTKPSWIWYWLKMIYWYGQTINNESKIYNCALINESFNIVIKGILDYIHYDVKLKFRLKHLRHQNAIIRYLSRMMSNIFKYILLLKINAVVYPKSINE